MSHIHRIVLAGLLLSTQACRSQDATFAPSAAEVPATDESMVEVPAADESVAGEPTVEQPSPGQMDPGQMNPVQPDPVQSGSEQETLASTPVAVPPEVLAVRTMVRTAEHDHLESLAGSFEVQGSFYPRPDTIARPVEGMLVTTWVDETAMLEGEFEGTLWGAPFTYVSETGFDPTLGCWIETWRTPDGAPIRGLAQGYDNGDGCVVTVRHEDGRTVRDEIQLGQDGIVRRIWRTTAEGVEYLSLELSGRRVD